MAVAVLTDGAAGAVSRVTAPSLASHPARNKPKIGAKTDPNSARIRDPQKTFDHASLKGQIGGVQSSQVAPDRRNLTATRRRLRHKGASSAPKAIPIQKGLPMMITSLLRRSSVMALVVLALFDADAARADALAPCNAASAVDNLLGTLDDSLECGADASAAGANATALGNAAQADGDLSLAVGDGAVASATRGTAIGQFAQAGKDGAGNNASAFGQSAQASGLGATALGAASDATGDNSIGIGLLSLADSADAIGIGRLAYGGAPGAIALGKLAGAAGLSTLAIGAGATAVREEALAIGTNAFAFDFNNVAIGTRARATALNSTAFGNRALASGTRSSAFGQESRATGSLATTTGTASIASGAGSAAYGVLAQASADNTTAVGSRAEASGAGSTALGQGATSEHAGSTALGAGAATTADNQVTLGASGTAVRIGDIAASTLAQVGPVDAVTVDANGVLGREQVATASSVANVRAALNNVAMITDAQFDGLSRRVAGIEGAVAGLAFDLAQLDERTSGGIAAAMALGGTMIVPGSTVSMSANVSTYGGEQGFSGSIAARLGQRVYVTAAIAGSSAPDSTGGRVGVAFGF
jgi:hypothetical protein